MLLRAFTAKVKDAAHHIGLTLSVIKEVNSKYERFYSFCLVQLRILSNRAVKDLKIRVRVRKAAFILYFFLMPKLKDPSCTFHHR